MPFLGNISTAEWIIIGVIVFLIFGQKKLTELGKGLGESTREMKRAKKEFSAAMNENLADVEDAPAEDLKAPNVESKEAEEKV